ncbi:MAG: sigma 54-interacting transcriptional regulator [Syntrophorhabdaceae bacterium]|nr:sigma 54-interacting transcriptional regulator [Syntrophorhabdaceae bacterium]
MFQYDLMSDKFNFFKEMTTRICSSMNLGKALYSCFLYIKEIIPVDTVMLVSYDEQLSAINIEAIAYENGGIEKDEKIFIPQPLRENIEEAAKYSRVRYIERLKDDPIINEISKFFGWEDAKIYVVRFILEEKYTGALILKSERNLIYNNRYIEFLNLINEPFAIVLSNHRRYKELLTIKNALYEEKISLQNELYQKQRANVEVIGADFGLKKVMENVYKVAPLSSPVLIYGETGTGKEVISQLIHSLSQRSDGPFIKLNCGAIPDTLIDSELFGHEKGSFTGAISQKKGRFERADKGTIFLDEVSELPASAQVRLLRVLQEKEFERVGGTHTIKVDVRVISATNRNLEELVKKGFFREDLFFRLNVFPIYIPPLRERLEDIPALVQHFIQKKFREMALPQIPVIKKGSIDVLMSYNWPGNVRELENVVERAIILSKGSPLDFEPIIAKGEKKEIFGNGKMTFPSLLDTEREHIIKALEISKGKVEGKGGAAELLNINPGTLRHRMRKLKIPFGRKRTL